MEKTFQTLFNIIRFTILKYIFIYIMSLSFAIIPITQSFLSTAYNIQTKLKNNDLSEINIVIDTDYNLSINNRTNKWKKQYYDIIIINQDYNESNTIIVRFSDKGSRAQSMLIDEFIDLVASFQDEDQHNIHHTRDSDNLNTNKQDEGCTIM